MEVKAWKSFALFAVSRRLAGDRHHSSCVRWGGVAEPELGCPLRRDHHMTIRRRLRRIKDMSFDRTTKPSGSIQKPSTGRNPKAPPTISADPKPIRPTRDLGIGIRHVPSASLPLRGSMPKCRLCGAATIQSEIPLKTHDICQRNGEELGIKQGISLFFKKPLGKSEKHAYYPPHTPRRGVPW